MQTKTLVTKLLKNDQLRHQSNMRIQPLMCKHGICSPLRGVNQISKPAQRKILKNHERTNNVWSLAVNSECTHEALFSCMNPDIMFISRTNLYHTLPKRINITKSNVWMSPLLCTSLLRDQLISGNISNKLIPQGIFSRVPTKLFTRRAAEEALEFEGFGWAGQPTVKRIHTVLPEGCGDVCDIFKATEKFKTISEIDTNLDLQAKNAGKSDILSVANKNADGAQEIGKNLDIVSVVSKNVDELVTKKVTIIENPNIRTLHQSGDKIYCRFSGVAEKHAKRRKKKKRTVVIVPKPGYPQKPSRKIRNKKLAANGNIRIDSRPEAIMQTNLILNRQSFAKPISRFYFHTVGRQFKTYSALEKPTKVAEKPKKDSPIIEDLSSDDCKCPVILYNIGKRKATKICGVAKGEGEKKKMTKWKPKMCPLEEEIRERNRTIVCVSEYEKEKSRRKRDLPKCPKVEKPDLPRTQICLPQIELEHEKKLKKKCVKQEEEVKIRKRTTVCKPIIVFASEKKLAITEKKAICTSTKVHKIKSRYTKICPPEGKLKEK